MANIDLNDPSTLKKLATSPIEDERLEFLDFLEEHIDSIPNAGEYLEMLASDKSRNVREVVAFVLSNNFERIQNAGKILEKLASDESIYIRMRVAAMLVHHYQKIPNARELYLALLNDPSNEVKGKLEEYLIERFGSPESFPEVFVQPREEGGEPSPTDAQEEVMEVHPSEEDTLSQKTAEDYEEAKPKAAYVGEVEMGDSVRVLAKRIGMLADALSENEMSMVLTSEFIEAMRNEIERIEKQKKLYSKIPL